MEKSRFLLVFIFSLVLIVGLAPQAEAQLGWFVAGYALGSGGSGVTGGSSGEVLYVLDSINEWIEDPLDIRTVSVTGKTVKSKPVIGATKSDEWPSSPSFRDIFRIAMRRNQLSSDDFTLLRISRLVDFSPGTGAVYWIEFIETTKIPVDKRPKKRSGSGT